MGQGRETPPGSSKAQWVHRLLSLLFLGGLVLAAYKYLSLDLMLQAWRKFSWPTLGVLVCLPAIYLCLKGYRFVLLMHSASEDKLSTKTLLRGYAASQSASLLPGGFAARAALMAQAGIPAERSVGPVLANGGMDQLVLLVLGLFLATSYRQVRPAALILTVVLLCLVAILVYAPSRSWVARQLTALADRFGKKQKMEEFHEACWALVSVRLFVSTFFLSLAADAISYGILCLVVAALGLQVEWTALAAAFVVPTLLGRLSPLPAGAGVTEAGMIAFMANQTAMSTNEAAAATMLMRAFDLVLPALYGAVIYFVAWKGEGEDATASSSPTAA